MEQPKTNLLQSFEEYKLRSIWQMYIPIIFRVRVIVIPIFICLVGLFILCNEPIWKIALLSSLLVLVSFIIMHDLFAFERIAKTESRLVIAVLIIPVAQLLIIFLTGGIESPIIYSIFAPIFLFNVLFSRTRYGFLFSSIYFISILIMGLGVYYDVLPNAAPDFLKLPFSFKANPIYFWVAFIVIIGAIFAVTGISRAIYTLGLTFFDELMQAREDLIQAQTDRMRDLETIGSRIAHEIKNPLVSIKGLTQLMGRKGSSFDPKDQERFQVIEEEILRIQGILEEFSSFTRPLDNLKVQQVNLKNTMQSCLLLYEYKFTSQGIKWIEEYDENTQITGDPGKLKQIFINLLQNAFDAMPNGGTISVEVRAVDHDWIMIAVSDTGSGIKQKDLEKLFDPYFTTKPEGSGLGLTIARSIARQHQGELTIKNNVNKGIVAHVTLPWHMDE